MHYITEYGVLGIVVTGWLSSPGHQSQACWFGHCSKPHAGVDGLWSEVNKAMFMFLYDLFVFLTVSA